MPTMMSALSLRLARPLAAAALFAAVGFAGVAPVRAEEAISPSAEEMVLVPVKTVQTLEQRVLLLEETVTALTESWQHIDTHRVCAADDSGAETCVTKVQLDMLLAHAAQAAVSAPAADETAQVAAIEDSADPAVVAASTKRSDDAPAEQQAVQAADPGDNADPAVAAANASPRSEPTAGESITGESITAESIAAEPAAVVTEIVAPDAEPETTGSVQPAITGAAAASFPHVEIYAEPVARTED